MQLVVHSSWPLIRRHILVVLLGKKVVGKNNNNNIGLIVDYDVNTKLYEILLEEE